MGGHPLRISETDEMESLSPAPNRALSEKLSLLRRFLIRLTVNTHPPAAVMEGASAAVLDTLGCACSFIEGDSPPEPAPGHLAVPVRSDGGHVGAFIVHKSIRSIEGMTAADLQEIADLVGAAVMNARRTEALAELESDSEDMLFHAPDAIFVTAADGIVKMANRRALEFANRDGDLVGEPLRNLLGDSQVSWKSLLLCARSAENLETEVSGPSGRRIVSLTPSVISDEADGERLLCVLRDVTAERQSHLAIRKSERTALMGQAVEYLLHEVNNPLAALTANLDRANRILSGRRSIPPGQGGTANGDAETSMEEQLSQVTAATEGARTAAARIRETMAVLRTARVGRSHRERAAVDVSYEIGLAIGAVCQEHPAATVERELSVSCRLFTEPLLIAESVGALLKNAVEAVGDSSEGRICVKAEETERDVRITVSDNGPGIPRHAASRVFMPFYSTKSLGQSLGLGLTMVEDALRRVGGAVRLLPQDGTGAVFEMALPK